MTNDDQKDQDLKILEMVREVVKYDEELRKQHNVGDKFRFVRDRLHVLLAHLEQQHAAAQLSTQPVKKQEATSDDTTVYVYLYNAHGINLKTWQNFLMPKLFYEYSVNRPIYAERNQIEELLRTKSNKVQHAYLAVTIKQADLLQTNGNAMKDAVGNTLIRVKEGALRFDQMLSFTHNGNEYTVNEKGELIKK